MVLISALNALVVFRGWVLFHLAASQVLPPMSGKLLGARWSRVQGGKAADLARTLGCAPYWVALARQPLWSPGLLVTVVGLIFTLAFYKEITMHSAYHGGWYTVPAQ